MAKVKPAFDTLRDIREGRMLDELSTELNELIRQIRFTDKKGSLTVKLDIEPVKGDAYMVTIKDDISVKAPKPDKSASLFYTTPDSNLQRNNPNQKQIPGLVEVDKSTGEIIETPEQLSETQEVS